MKKIKTYFLSLLVIYASLLTMACPEKAKLENLQEKSTQVASIANEGVNFTRELFRARIISPEQTRRIAEGFSRLADGGMAFESALDQAIAEAGTNPAAAGVKERIIKLFRSNILDKFLDVLDQLKLVHVSDRLRTAINGIKLAVVAIGTTLDIGKDVRREIETKGVI